MSDYIKLAGGLTTDASNRSTFVTFPNGISKKMPIFGYSPQILDGSKIYVGLKEEVEPFSFTEYLTNITSIYADLSQAYLLLILARNN